MGKRFIGFRLRKELDDDVAEAIEDMDGNSVSELARLGIRMALGMTSQKVVEVTEKPLGVPKPWIKK